MQVQAIEQAIELTLDKDSSDDFTSWVMKTHLVVDEDEESDWDDEDEDEIEDEIDISDDNILGNEDEDDDD